MGERRVDLHVQGAGGHIAVTMLEDERSMLPPHETIVFLHPTNLDARCWLPVAKRVGGYRRVLLDSRGHGASHRNPPFRITDYAADVCAVLDQLALEDVHLVGGSLGGSIACAVAARIPHNITSVFAVGAALEPADDATLAWLNEAFDAMSVQAIFEASMEHELARGLAPEILVEALQQVDIERRGRELIRAITLNAFSEDARHLAQDVRCQVCVLTGEFDESCPPAAGRRMAELLLARFDILPGLGHLAMMQAPELIAEKLLDSVREACNA